MSESPTEKSLGAGSDFEKFLFERFGPNPRPGFAAPLAAGGVFLCFVNRSGSNYLAECLASSGDFPRARELFLKSNLLRHQAAVGDGGGLSGIFESIVAKHRVNGIFASKLGHAQLAAFDSLGFLDAAFDRTWFLFLKRRDTLAQAVSLEVASQTRQWKPDGGRSIESPDLEYSRQRIELKRKGIEEKYDRLRAFFDETGRSPLTIFYEDLVSRPAETVRAVGEFVGLRLECDPEFANSSQSVAPLKEAWRRRFLEGG